MSGSPSPARRAKIRLRGTSLLAALPWLLAGCQIISAVPPAEQEIEVVTPEDSLDIGSLIRYGYSIRELTADELETEYQAILMQGMPDNRPELRFRLVLLLGVPEAPLYDLNRAVSLLDDYISNRTSQGSPDADFAALLIELYAERLAIEINAAEAAEQLSEERGQTIQREQELQSTRAELDFERSQNETLRQQLNALIALEEQISLEEAVRPETQAQ